MYCSGLCIYPLYSRLPMRLCACTVQYIMLEYIVEMRRLEHLICTEIVLVGAKAAPPIWGLDRRSANGFAYVLQRWGM